MKLLEISNLHASIDGQPILRGVDLTIREGEVHSIMGPNGSGKSTLTKVLAGHEDYEVTHGSISYRGQDLLALSPDERAAAGVFLAFQYPVEIPGVSNMQFLRAAVNAQRKRRSEPEVDPMQFLKVVREKVQVLEMNQDLLKRSVNEGFSGGEKKRHEVLQMCVLEPTLCLLDETDSGLDIDALKVVSKGVNSLRDGRRGMLLVTHYQRLLTYIVPDFVHVMMGGRLVRSGGKELALELEERGYASVDQHVATSRR